MLDRRYFHQPGEDPIVNLQGGQDWVAGWGKVAMIRDLTSLMPAPLPATGEYLHHTWSVHAEQLDDAIEKDNRTSANEANTALREAINQTRKEIVELIQSLE
ncbi:MAG: hypothetical protein AAF446_08280 [Pseudomonadota bacterium]